MKAIIVRTCCIISYAVCFDAVVNRLDRTNCASDACCVQVLRCTRVVVDRGEIICFESGLLMQRPWHC